MANTIDIAPGTGHAVLSTQGGVGGTPGYDSIDLRRLTDVGWQEGVHDSGGWKVTEHSPNGMLVDVASSIGLGTIQGDSIGNQGRYVVAPHGSNVSLDITAANATNPRLDQILLRVWDTIHDGLGANKATVEVLNGTPTAGATLDNRNGAASLWPNAIRLADVLVGASVGTITNSVIRDRRKWANGAYYRSVYSGSAISKSSATFQVLDASQLQARIECSGNHILCTAVCQITVNPGILAVYMDGSQIDPISSGTYASSGGVSAAPGNTNFSVYVDPSSGSHVFTLMGCAAVGGSAATFTQYPLHFALREQTVTSANNGTA